MNEPTKMLHHEIPVTIQIILEFCTHIWPLCKQFVFSQDSFTRRWRDATNMKSIRFKSSVFFAIRQILDFSSFLSLKMTGV